jgi:hypothetical protein
MAAPTNAAEAKILLANPEPSTHGPKRKYRYVALKSALGDKADIRLGSPDVCK